MPFILHSFTSQVPNYAYLTCVDRSERDYIAECKRQIEEKFHFGNGQGELRQRDFEYLADAIEEKSGIKLSLSTLKRLWKNDYDKTPHPATLQALVSLLGYKDWHEYKLQNTGLPETPAVATSSKRQLQFKPWVLAPIVLAAAVLVWLIAFRSKPAHNRPVIKGPVTLTGNKTVSQGVPNTVVFNYDLSNVDADSFFFQQSWDPNERIRLDQKEHVYTAIYYYPGFHRAKLIANDSIIQKFRVHITTDGWFPMVRQGNDRDNPIYLKKENCVSNGVLHIKPGHLPAAGIDPSKDYVSSFFNVRDFDVHSDNFILETRMKADIRDNVNCPGIELTLLTEEHIYIVRLMRKGCERDAAVKMGEQLHVGSNKDLSMFGRDLTEWQHLKIKVVNKQATIFLDDQPVYNLSYKNDFGKIVGLVYHFAGTGAVDYLRLSGADGQPVFVDEFEN